MHSELIKILKELSFWKNHKLLWLSYTSSTNDDLKALWHDKDFCHCIEVADIQTNGKGQYERKWSSDNEGQNLMFSFSVDVKEYAFPVSMIAGVALASALEKMELSTKDFWLKWPNDIWVNDKKLAGILTESTTFAGGFRSVVGIGINILPLADKTVNAVSLSEYGLDYSREEVLINFCKSWNNIFSLPPEEQCLLWNNFAGQFWKREFSIIIPNEEKFIARPIKVEDDGTLIVKKNNNQSEKRIISASLLPILDK